MSAQPIVSVLVPIKNEEKNIANCLFQIAGQSYDQNKLEILIIDGMSTDNTRKIINDFKSQFPNLKINVLDDKAVQRSAGLNQGIQQATGDVILRIDARTVIPKDYIENCVEALIKTGADNVGGIQKPIEGGSFNLTQTAIGQAMSHPFGVGNAQFRLGKKSGYVDSVYLGCFWKKVFETVGLFDEESSIITEDSDINYRIRKKGGKVYLNKDIIAYYVPRERLIDLAKLYFRYGGARAGFLLKWKTYTGYRQLVPPLFIVILILLPLLSLFSISFLYLWCCFIAIYLCANIGFSFDGACKNKQMGVFFRLILVFPIMHFCWASGFWVRLLQGKKNNQYWGY